MLKFNSITFFVALLSIARAELSGPFLIWGGKNLISLKVPALEGSLISQ
jgi:hypothetical protein